MLTPLLEQLEAQWVRLGAPIARALRPGLSETELDSIAARLGLDLPGELRELWAWHDGADPEFFRDIGPGGYVFLTSEEVIAERDRNVALQPESPEPDLLPEMFWHRTWIPFMTQDAQRLYIDAARETTTGSSPIRLVTWEWEDFTVDRAPSLGAAVSMWTWLLQSDYFRWEGDTWSRPVDYRSIPLFARWTMA